MPALRSLICLRGVAAFAAAFVLLAPVAADADEDAWPQLKQQTFGDRAIHAEDGAVVLEIPGTAEDASLVPLTVRITPSVTQKLQSLTLIIDKNPDPLVAVLSFGPAAGSGGERSFSTRVRIDSFSHVRAVLAPLGPDNRRGRSVAAVPDVRFRLARRHGGVDRAARPSPRRLNINTADIIPARFVKEVTVKRGGELVFQMQSTFSISTNPNFRFTFGRGADNSLEVVVKDTDGAVFTAQSAPSGS